MKKIIEYKIATVIVFLMLILVSYRVKSPLLLWNRTESVPKGIYLRINIRKIKENQDYFVSIHPRVLDAVEIYATSNNLHAISTIEALQQSLISHNIFLIKKISQVDKNYILKNQALPETLYVESVNTVGLDSKFFGRIKRSDINGVYILVLSSKNPS